MTARDERITHGLRYLATEMSASRPEFCRDNQPDGAALFEGLQGLGYVRRGNTRETFDRYALSEPGQRRLAAVETEATV